MRKAASSAVCILGVVVVIIGIFMSFTYRDLVTNVIDHDHMIRTSFLVSSNYIKSFKDKHSRLPSQSELDEWASEQGGGIYGPKNILLYTNNFPEIAIDLFGDPSKKSYLLGIWRGEWYEYYASWANDDSLEPEKSKYLFTRLFWWTDVLVVFLMGALAIYVARLMWPRQSRDST